MTTHEKAVAAAASYKRAESALIDALIDVDREKIFAKMGYSSLFVYAVKALGLSEPVACNFIAVARKAKQVPQLQVEIAQGRLSVTKARKIASVINSTNHSHWIDLAKASSLRLIEREVAAVRPQEVTPEHAKYVSKERLLLSLGVTEKLMLKLRRAQDQVSRSRNHAATLEETLEVLVEFYIQRKDPLERAKRVIAKKGNPTEIVQTSVPGQKHMRQPIPAAIQHQVRLRDEGRCQHPGCSERRWIDLHHVKPVAQGGEHSVANLTTLCKAHHRFVHTH